MKIEYFEKWFFAERRAVLPLPAAEAEVRHGASRAYVAVLIADDGDTRVVMFAGDFVNVLFLDDARRPQLEYEFIRAGEGRIFLQRALRMEFVGDTNEPANATTVRFKQDGSIHIEKMDRASDTVEATEVTADPSLNWDQYPQFGELDSISRFERGVNS